ncbi:bifunctional NAD(P)H-hydrate repair enzyme [Sulfurimicrobium lacus]|uniref:Bifunctional NAD(P)H-hydrate repair enzyme n=1 Tax=Sulfurimicrobium lacus TaxID=2715678 RepID=A0A6F8VDW0_9PROT|nr:NAD(P)H-hydrate dehydratase [Sulfurimicrobium lacus]BCB27530.1 bifunctional NAD(P)H-hydrate repair enzyme [Sulfurimicrobium lacus]
MLVANFPNSQPLYRSHDIRLIEQAAAELSPFPSLMERAGEAAAELAVQLLGNRHAVLVLAGPGNNGGDALVAARHLKARWFQVTVVLAGEPAKLPPDAAAALQAWLDCGGEVLPAIPADGNWDIVLDGLFGIGLERDLGGMYLELVKQVNRMGISVLSLDIPSGLDSETGQPFRAAVRADHTLTFIGLKPGLFTAYGPDYCGRVHLATLDLPPELLPPVMGQLIGASDVASYLKPRPRNSHKGMLGSVGVLGGAESMCGAAFMAARSALLLGAGRVYLGLLAENAPCVDILQPELMLRMPDQLLEMDLDCLVIGPGLGQSAQALGYLERALQSEIKLVIDADALNLLGSHAELQSLLKKRTAVSILTPHPAEAGRLLSCSSHEIQQDRIGSAQVLASRLNSLLVLKGAGTVCAWPDESWHINPSGNPGLSSGGMGDILCGMIAALLGQRLSAEKATLLAVYLHGRAADELVKNGSGPIGLTTSEVAIMARTLLNRWVYGDAVA